MRVENGMPADELPMARWRKSSASNPSGSCVEIAELPGGKIAIRNSRDKAGPALIYPRAEVAAFLQWLTCGEFERLAGLLPTAAAIPREPHNTRSDNARMFGVSCFVHPPPDAFGPFPGRSARRSCVWHERLARPERAWRADS